MWDQSTDRPRVRQRCSKTCSSSTVSWWHRATKLGREMATGSFGRLGRRHEVGVVGEARVAADPEVVLHPALGGQPVVVPPHGVEDGRAPHALEAGHGVGVGVGEDVADVERARHRGRRGVDGEDLVAGGGPVEGVDALVLPAGRPGRLEALEARASRGSPARAGRRGRPVRSASGMIGLPYPACSGSTTPPPARWRPLRLREPGPGRPCTCAGRRSTACPTSATAGSPWSSTCSAATCCSAGWT